MTTDTTAPPLPVEVSPEEPQWTTVIRPPSGWIALDIRQLWRYRDLIMLFVRRDFTAAYKQTILGPLWHILQPLLTTITFTVVFGNIAKLPTDGLPKFLFYMSGTVIWTYFAACLQSTSNTFVENASLFGKVYFARLVIPISVVISRLTAFAIQCAIFAALVAWFAARGAGVHPNAWILATPLLVAAMAGMGMGFGVLVSAFTTRYRDLAQLVAFGVQLAMYATPVIYPSSSIPARYRAIADLNPLSPIIETFRYGFLGAGALRPAGLAYSAVCMLAVLALGLILFTRVERTFVDTV